MGVQRADWLETGVQYWPESVSLNPPGGWKTLPQTVFNVFIFNEKAEEQTAFFSVLRLHNLDNARRHGAPGTVTSIAIYYILTPLRP